MSIYLDKATLPSPCWMICGAMGRVCQDIGLGRKPPNSKFSPLELEARSRLFWGAYIQDKRVSMKMGRPWILRSEDCDAPLPATLDDDGVGAPVSGLPPDSQPVRDQVAVTRRALSTFKATIHACITVESVLGVKPLPRKGGEAHKNRLQELDHELLKAWAMLPPELSDAERPEPLDFACVRGRLICTVCLSVTYISARNSVVHHPTCSFNPIPALPRPSTSDDRKERLSDMVS
jgi:hypothetical protein